MFFQAVVVVIENGHLVIDTSNEAVDFKSLVRQFFDVLLCLDHLFDVLVTLLSDDCQYIVDFLTDFLFSGNNLLFDLLKEDFVKLTELFLQTLLQVTNAGHNWSHQEGVFEEKLVDLI